MYVLVCEAGLSGQIPLQGKTLCVNCRASMGERFLINNITICQVNNSMVLFSAKLGCKKLCGIGHVVFPRLFSPLFFLDAVLNLSVWTTIRERMAQDV